MSYGSGGNRESRTKMRGNSKMDKKPKEKKAGGNSPPKKSAPSRNGLKRLTDKQMERLKEHSKQHKGGMSSPHMKKMMMVMTKEGKSFSEAHKIAMRHDKMKKK